MAAEGADADRGPPARRRKLGDRRRARLRLHQRQRLYRGIQEDLRLHSGASLDCRLTKTQLDVDVGGQETVPGQANLGYLEGVAEAGGDAHLHAPLNQYGDSLKLDSLVSPSTEAGCRGALRRAKEGDEASRYGCPTAFSSRLGQ